jgi:hypothetical protein
MNLLAEEGAYTLIIDSQLPMASIMLQSKQDLDILDIKDNMASINRSTQIQDPSIQSLVYLVLCSEDVVHNHNRIEIKIRTSEGQQGFIQALIVPKNSEGCQSLEIPLLPLNLHSKIHKIDPSVKDQLILSTITIKSPQLCIHDAL